MGALGERRAGSAVAAIASRVEQSCEESLFGTQSVDLRLQRGGLALQSCPARTPYDRPYRLRREARRHATGLRDGTLVRRGQWDGEGRAEREDGHGPSVCAQAWRPIVFEHDV